MEDYEGKAGPCFPRWEQYLQMRDGILRINAAFRESPSSDLGVIAGSLFNVRFRPLSRSGPAW